MITDDTEYGRNIHMRMTVADVGKVLMSVAKACESGYKVVFDEEGSYVEHKSSGEWLPMVESEGGLFELRMWVNNVF